MRPPPSPNMLGERPKTVLIATAMGWTRAMKLIIQKRQKSTNYLFGPGQIIRYMEIWFSSFIIAVRRGMPSGWGNRPESSPVRP